MVQACWSARFDGSEPSKETKTSWYITTSSQFLSLMIAPSLVADMASGKTDKFFLRFYRTNKVLQKIPSITEYGNLAAMILRMLACFATSNWRSWLISAGIL
jgi:hypothetical protein